MYLFHAKNNFKLYASIYRRIEILDNEEFNMLLQQ